MTFDSFSGGVDFIGDVHGCYESLCALLEKLGYTQSAGCFCYKGAGPARKVVFLGDIIDRGPQVREVVQCVHAMVEAGEAQMVMGNHEFHAICFYLPRGNKSGEYIRSHTPYHYSLLQNTLNAFADYPEEWAYYRQWFLQRPIFIDHPQFRVVHACWDQKLIDQYMQRYQRNTIDAEFISHYYDADSFSYDFLERLMRGIELELPLGVLITGTDGKKRCNFRARFWLENPQTYDQVIFRPHMLPNEMRGVALSAEHISELVYYKPQEKPLFLGHYWRTGRPKPLTANIVCVDYSAVRDGQLVAYRFDGEQVLSAEKFVAVDACEGRL